MLGATALFFLNKMLNYSKYMMPHQRYGGPPKQQRVRVNGFIKSPEVKVIDTGGEMLGVMPLHQAMAKAQEQSLDLVEIGPNVSPPIVKIMDYGRYMYEKERKERGSKSGKIKGDEIKTVKIGFRTELHDMQVRAAQIDKFLQKKYRVRVELNLRGREKGLVPVARKKLDTFLMYVSEPHAVDVPLKAMPNSLSVTLKPEK